MNLLAHPFRIFFLMTGLYGALVMLAWLAFLFAGWSMPVGPFAFKWHSHEMLYGLVPAATAGFLLTAMTNWTGAKPLQGRGLLMLVLVWICGRAAMWLSNWLPPWLVAVVDLAFLVVLASYVGRVLISHNNKRNFLLVAVLILLALGNLMMHMGFSTGVTGWLQAGQLVGFDIITLLMIIIAGRITPNFSINWLRGQGQAVDAVRQVAWLDRAALASVGLLILLDLIRAPTTLTGAAALLSAAINLVRLVFWAGWKTWREPLLWILHIAYLWVVLALLLRGLSAFTSLIPATVWQHALGVGAIATLILGVMTRVAMGHTGRPLKLVQFGLLIYLAVLAAAVVRVLVALQWVDFRFGITMAGLCWIGAFGLFCGLYWPALSRPRADGKPG